MGGTYLALDGRGFYGISSFEIRTGEVSVSHFTDPGVEIWVCCGCGSPLYKSELLCTECAFEEAAPWEPPSWILIPITGLVILVVIGLWWYLDTAWQLHCLFKGVSR